MQVAPTIDETIPYIVWQNKEYYDTKLFSTQLTAEGICFTFNSLGQNDMYTDQM